MLATRLSIQPIISLRPLIVAPLQTGEQEHSMHVVNNIK